MTNLTVPTRKNISGNNKVLFSNLKQVVEIVPNIYTFITNSSTTLRNYLILQNRKSSLNNKEKEVVTSEQKANRSKVLQN